MYCRIVPNKTTVLVEAALGKACDKDTSVTAWDVSNADTHLLISVFSVCHGVCAVHTVMQQGSRYASILLDPCRQCTPKPGQPAPTERCRTGSITWLESLGPLPAMIEL